MAIRHGAPHLVLPRSRFPEKEKTDAVLRPPMATEDLDVTAVAATVLKIFREFADADLIVEDVKLDSLGLDSLSIIELRNSIANATGVELEAATMLSNPSVGEIIETLTAEVSRLSKNPVASPTQADDVMPDDTPFEVQKLDLTSHPCSRALARPALFVLSTLRSGSSLL